MKGLLLIFCVFLLASNAFAVPVKGELDISVESNKTVYFPEEVGTIQIVLNNSSDSVLNEIFLEVESFDEKFLIEKFEEKIVSLKAGENFYSVFIDFKISKNAKPGKAFVRVKARSASSRLTSVLDAYVLVEKPTVNEALSKLLSNLRERIDVVSLESDFFSETEFEHVSEKISNAFSLLSFLKTELGKNPSPGSNWFETLSVLEQDVEEIEKLVFNKKVLVNEKKQKLKSGVEVGFVKDKNFLNNSDSELVSTAVGSPSGFVLFAGDLSSNLLGFFTVLCVMFLVLFFVKRNRDNVPPFGRRRNINHLERLKFH